MNNMNMTRKRFCKSDRNFENYYLQQAGNGYSDFNIYKGIPYQRGYGLGSFLKRYGIPIAKYLGRNLWNTGVAIGQDLIANEDPKLTVKKHLKRTAKIIAKDSLQKLGSLIDQEGSGRKRYTNKTKYKLLKRQKPNKQDVFGKY